MCGQGKDDQRMRRTERLFFLTVLSVMLTILILSLVAFKVSHWAKDEVDAVIPAAVTWPIFVDYDYEFEPVGTREEGDWLFEDYAEVEVLRNAFGDILYKKRTGEIFTLRYLKNPDAFVIID